MQRPKTKSGLPKINSFQQHYPMHYYYTDHFSVFTRIYGQVVASFFCMDISLSAYSVEKIVLSGLDPKLVDPLSTFIFFLLSLDTVCDIKNNILFFK